MICELRHVASVSVPDTTYFVVSLKNGAPGSSSTVRVDHAGSNISYVVRPSRIPLDRAVAAPIASPICGSKPYSNVHVGASTTPSRLMNSCTCISPTSDRLAREGGEPEAERRQRQLLGHVQLERLAGLLPPPRPPPRRARAP